MRQLASAAVVAATLAACGGPPAAQQTTPARAGDPGASAVGVDEAADPESSEAAAIAAIESAVNRFAPAVHRCWRRAAAADYHVAGRVTLAVSIGSGGATTDVALAEDGVKHPLLSACLVELWKTASWPEVFAAGDTVQVPLVFVAPDAQHVIAVTDVPPFDLGRGSSARVVLDEQSTGNPAASLSVVRYAPGFVAPLHRHAAAEVLFVVSGAGRLTDADGARTARSIGPGDVILADVGVAHGIEATSAAPLEAVVIHAPAGAEATLEGRTDAGTTLVTASRRSRAKGSPHLVRVAEVTPVAVPGGSAEARVLLDRGRGEGAMGLVALTSPAGTREAPHVHETATELLYVLEGRATLTIAGDSHDVEAGEAVQIPPGVQHGWVVADGTTLKVLQAFTPAGAEQGYRLTSELPS